jgi:hypothetical protein
MGGEVQGRTISLIGCVFGEYAPGPDEEEEEPQGREYSMTSAAFYVSCQW